MAGSGAEPRSLPPEFAFIARHFRSLASAPEALALSDDAALVSPRSGRALVFTADAMVENVHFLPDDPPDDLGRKLLRVNLSDLAAMGADPRFYLLTLSIPPGKDDAFFARFAAGLAADQDRFGVGLLGGDTTRTAGPLAMSLTAIGDVPEGQAVRRNGAKPGDRLMVTGTIGAGALGLRALRGLIADPDGVLARAYRLPEPRLLPIRGVATAAIDVSDGLLQDAMHVARASGVVLEIEEARVPLPRAALGGDAALRELCLTGGDDYELLLTVPPARAAGLEAACAAHGVTLSTIGTVREGSPDLVLRRADGSRREPDRLGWSHL